MAARREMTPKQLASALERAPKAIAKQVTSAFKLTGVEFVGQVRLNLRGRPGLRTRSHRLIDSLFQKVTGDNDLDRLELRTGSAGVPYARIQEKGGKVVAKNGGALTVPIEENMIRLGLMTPTGIQTIPNKVLRAQGRTFLLKRPGAAPLIMYVQGSGYDAFAIPIFVLKKSVTIPPRLRFFDTWKRLAPTRRARLDAAVRRGLKEAAGL